MKIPFWALGRLWRLVKEATQGDTVLLLLIQEAVPPCRASHARGSPLADIQAVTRQLLFCGAGITEINVPQKAVRHEGQQVRQIPERAKAYSIIILSDIIGDNDDMIASRPDPIPTIPQRRGKADYRKNIICSWKRRWKIFC